MTEGSPSAGGLDRETYRRLIRPRNGVALAHLGLRTGFHLCILTLALHLASGGRLFAALLVLTPHWAAWSFLGWAGLGHELAPRNVLSWRQANVALFRICSILTWSNFAFFELTHPIHHRPTLDRRISKPMRGSGSRPGRRSALQDSISWDSSAGSGSSP